MAGALLLCFRGWCFWPGDVTADPLTEFVLSITTEVTEPSEVFLCEVFGVA